MSSLAVGRLSDGRLQVWRLNLGKIETTWKVSTSPDSKWVKWTPFQVEGTALSRAMHICAASLPGGGLQLWCSDETHGFVSTWKKTIHPNAAWGAWVKVPGSPPQPGSIVAAPLPDGRLQLWVHQDGGDRYTWTTWKVTTDATAPWHPWQMFPAFHPWLPIAAACRSDGRLQMWGTRPAGDTTPAWEWALHTKVKASSSPNAGWSGIEAVSKRGDNDHIPPHFPPDPTATSGAAAGLADFRVQLWICTTKGEVLTAWEPIGGGALPTAWQPFATKAEVGSISSLAAGMLPNRALQVWGSGVGPIWTRWKRDSDANSPWTPWDTFEPG